MRVSREKITRFFFFCAFLLPENVGCECATTRTLLTGAREISRKKVPAQTTKDFFQKYRDAWSPKRSDLSFGALFFVFDDDVGCSLFFYERQKGAF